MAAARCRCTLWSAPSPTRMACASCPRQVASFLCLTSLHSGRLVIKCSATLLLRCVGVLVQCTHTFFAQWPPLPCTACQPTHHHLPLPAPCPPLCPTCRCGLTRTTPSATAPWLTSSHPWITCSPRLRRAQAAAVQAPRCSSWCSSSPTAGGWVGGAGCGPGWGRLSWTCSAGNARSAIVADCWTSKGLVAVATLPTAAPALTPCCRPYASPPRRFHEKESLRRMVRAAADKPGVLYAFIVLDNPANSILDMQVRGAGLRGWMHVYACLCVLRCMLCMLSTARYACRPATAIAASQLTPPALPLLPCPCPVMSLPADCELRGRQARVCPLHGLLPLPLLHCAARHRRAAAHPGRPHAPVV